jgi:hypothetical protein
MKRFAQWTLLFGGSALASLLLSACNFFNQPADLQTENLQNELAQTQIAAVRATATINADRMLITLESAQTAVANVDLQSTSIASTLIAGGMAFVDASGITPVASTQEASVATSTPGSQIANPLLTPGAPVINSGGAAQGDSALVPTTPIAPNDQATEDVQVDPSAPNLTNITLSDAVGADDCPLSSATSFSSSTTEIYVSAVGNNIPASATLDSLWLLEGTQVQDYSWSPGFVVDGVCIWFRLPSSEVTFTPGNWSVQLTIDGVSAGALDFTITGDTPAEIDPNS